MGTVEARKSERKEDKAAPAGDKRDALTIRDGRVYEVPIAHGTIRATDLRRGRQDRAGSFGLMTYDPAFSQHRSRYHVHFFFFGHPPPRLSDRRSSPRSATTWRSRTFFFTASLSNRQQLKDWVHAVHVTTPMIHESAEEEIDGRLPTTTRTRWGMLHRQRSAAMPTF